MPKKKGPKSLSPLARAAAPATLDGGFFAPVAPKKPSANAQALERARQRYPTRCVICRKKRRRKNKKTCRACVRLVNDARKRRLAAKGPREPATATSRKRKPNPPSSDEDAYTAAFRETVALLQGDTEP